MRPVKCLDSRMPKNTNLNNFDLLNKVFFCNNFHKMPGVFNSWRINILSNINEKYQTYCTFLWLGWVYITKNTSSHYLVSTEIQGLAFLLTWVDHDMKIQWKKQITIKHYSFTSLLVSARKAGSHEPFQISI